MVRLTAGEHSSGAHFRDHPCILSISSKMQTLSGEQKPELRTFPTELSHLTTELLNHVWARNFEVLSVQ